MKKLILLLLPALTLAQGLRFNDKEYFTVSLINDPRASIKEGGLYIGGEIEYVGKVYTRLGVDNFAVLEDGYTSVIGGIGINLTSGYFDKVRYYTGVRLGVIKRHASNATAGIEAGFDVSVTDNVFVGLRATYDYNSDFAFYDYPSKTQWREFVRVGVKF